MESSRCRCQAVKIFCGVGFRIEVPSAVTGKFDLFPPFRVSFERFFDADTSFGREVGGGGVHGLLDVVTEGEEARVIGELIT